MKLCWSMAVLLLGITPSVVSAGIPTDLVPCGDTLDGVEQPACQACHVYALAENVFTWIFGVASLIVTIIIVVGGLRLVTAAGNQQVKQSARRLITTAIVGFVLIGSAWVLVELLIATLMGVETDGTIFSSIECVP
jgi:hypothetical protein